MARLKRKKLVKPKSKQVKNIKGQPAVLTEMPTPEMQARVKFELGQIINETGQRIGLAYRRKPLLETLATSGAFSPDELTAMRFYRIAFDRTERSLVKSCLNIINGGRSDGPADVLTMTPGMIDAKRKLEYCERALGPNLYTMRGVILNDLSFSELAMQRYGSRLRPATSGKTKPAPKSGRHREYIRQEFLSGVKLLTNAISEIVYTGPTEEIWVEPLPDGSAVVRRGLVAPASSYRCWADPLAIDQVLTSLKKEIGNSLVFTTENLAIHAIKLLEIVKFNKLL